MSSNNQRVTVQAGLQMALCDDKDQKGYVTLVNGELALDTVGDKLCYSKLLDDIYLKMRDIAAFHSEGQAHEWRLYMAHDGRCWFIEPDDNGGNPSGVNYALGYLDFPCLEDWIITGAVPVE